MTAKPYDPASDAKAITGSYSNLSLWPGEHERALDAIEYAAHNYLHFSASGLRIVWDCYHQILKRMPEINLVRSRTALHCATLQTTEQLGLLAMMAVGSWDNLARHIVLDMFCTHPQALEQNFVRLALERGVWVLSGPFAIEFTRPRAMAWLIILYSLIGQRQEAESYWRTLTLAKPRKTQSDFDVRCFSTAIIEMRAGRHQHALELFDKHTHGANTRWSSVSRRVLDLVRAHEPARGMLGKRQHQMSTRSRKRQCTETKDCIF